jgi:hypothetical protein
MRGRRGEMMLFPEFFILIYLAILMFIALWPVLIWSHLREHTIYLREIRDLLKEKKN